MELHEIQQNEGECITIVETSWITHIARSSSGENLWRGRRTAGPATLVEAVGGLAEESSLLLPTSVVIGHEPRVLVTVANVSGELKVLPESCVIARTHAVTEVQQKVVGGHVSGLTVVLEKKGSTSRDNFA